MLAKRTRKREFLEEMNRVVPWSGLVALIAPHAPGAKTGRPPTRRRRETSGTSG